MIKKNRLWIFFLLIVSCIGEDIINDYVSPNLRITNPIISIREGVTYRFTAKFFDTAGDEVAQPQLQWSTQTPTVISVNDTGIITALSPGQAVLILITQSRLGETIQTEHQFEVTAIPIDTETSTTSDTNVDTITSSDTNLDTTTGTDTSTTSSDTTTSTETVIVVSPQFFEGQVKSTSSYLLQGNYQYCFENDVLTLNLDDTYRADTALPGLYVYLGNNLNTVYGAYEIGKVTVFEGEHSYSLPASFGLMDYKYILYWCKPFNVKVGDAQLFD